MGHRYPWKWNLSDLPEPSADAPTVFSTFACGGGSSMGYKRAGFRVIGNCEIDPRIAKVYETNLHPEHSYVMDLRDFNELDDLPEELYDLDVLDGSPPCSTFSACGSREASWGVEKRFAEGQALQRLDDLFFVFLDTVDKLKPKAFVAENVVGLIQGNARSYTTQILKKAKAIGYEVFLFKLDSSLMGCPQRRERVFFIGNRMGWGPLSIPKEPDVVTFGEVRSSEPGRPLWPSAARLFAESRPTDTSLREAEKRRSGKDSFFNYKICADGKPSSTVTAGCRLIRRCDGTFFSDVDIRNVSTFPQDYDFCGRSAQFICGMSVPPSMMANVAHEVRVQWLGKEKQRV